MARVTYVPHEIVYFASGFAALFGLEGTTTPAGVGYGVEIPNDVAAKLFQRSESSLAFPIKHVLIIASLLRPRTSDNIIDNCRTFSSLSHTP